MISISMRKRRRKWKNQKTMTIRIDRQSQCKRSLMMILKQSTLARSYFKNLLKIPPLSDIIKRNSKPKSKMETCLNRIRRINNRPLLTSKFNKLTPSWTLIKSMSLQRTRKCAMKILLRQMARFMTQLAHDTSAKKNSSLVEKPSLMDHLRGLALKSGVDHMIVKTWKMKWFHRMSSTTHTKLQ